MKIYTKTGDSGETGLIGGSRVAKSSLRIQAIGEVDELNATIGWAATLGGTIDLLTRIQCDLFDLGAELASADERGKSSQLRSRAISELEVDIDRQTETLEPLRNFILPGGCELASRLHLARASCRRAERSVVALAQTADLRPEAISYLNRLADWLFTAARTANREQGVVETKWSKSEEE